MSSSLRIPYGAWILVADARKALLLSNEGDEVHLDLRVVQTLHAPTNERTSSQGADRPGRAIVSGKRRSAVGQTDWHRLAEEQFAATTIETLFAKDRPHALIIVAPPMFLAELRKQLSDPVKAAVLAEIDKDLTHLTIGEIEQNLSRR